MCSPTGWPNGQLTAYPACKHAQTVSQWGIRLAHRSPRAERGTHQNGQVETGHMDQRALLDVLKPAKPNTAIPPNKTLCHASTTSRLRPTVFVSHFIRMMQAHQYNRSTHQINHELRCTADASSARPSASRYAHPRPSSKHAHASPPFAYPLPIKKRPPIPPSSPSHFRRSGRRQLRGQMGGHEKTSGLQG